MSVPGRIVEPEVPPRSIVPAATDCGAPRLLLGSSGAPPFTLLSEETLSAPLLIVVLPVYVLAPLRIQVVAPVTLLVRRELPLITPEISPVPPPWSTN